jgi:glutamyl-tRNA synthetase
LVDFVQELAVQRADAEAKSLPPKYSGKWATASKAEVEAELQKGTPHTYRFRVPQDGKVVIQDMIRGEVRCVL